MKSTCVISPIPHSGKLGLLFSSSCVGSAPRNGGEGRVTSAPCWVESWSLCSQFCPAQLALCALLLSWEWAAIDRTLLSRQFLLSHFVESHAAFKYAAAHQDMIESGAGVPFGTVGLHSGETGCAAIILQV